jgi:hypothetical protein
LIHRSSKTVDGVKHHLTEPKYLNVRINGTDKKICHSTTPWCDRNVMRINRINSIFGKYENHFNAAVRTKMARKLNGEPLETTILPTEDAKEKQTKQKAAAKKQQPPLKERMTVQISREVIEGLKDIVYWNRLTVAQFVEDALREAIIKAENENGGTFKKRASKLRPGRPLK